MKSFKELRLNLNESEKREKEMRRKAALHGHIEGDLDPEGGVDETGTPYRAVKTSPKISKLRQFMKSLRDNPLRKKLLNTKTLAVAGLVGALASTAPEGMIGKPSKDMSSNIAKIAVQIGKEGGSKDEEEMLRKALGLGENALLPFMAYTYMNEGLVSTIGGFLRDKFDKIYDEEKKPIVPTNEHKPTERPNSIRVNSVKARIRNRLSNKSK